MTRYILPAFLGICGQIIMAEIACTIVAVAAVLATSIKQD